MGFKVRVEPTFAYMLDLHLHKKHIPFKACSFIFRHFGEFGSGCIISLQTYQLDQTEVDTLVRIWGTHYQNRQKNGKK